MGEMPQPSLSFLSLKAEDFGLMGSEIGVATGGDLVCCLASVAAAPDVAAETPLSLMETRDELWQW